nr:hypothetical protein DEO72_LG3g1106 [Ipomoea batatas]
MFLLQTISSQIDRLRLSPMSSSFGTIDNICNPLNAAAPIGDDGEEGADDWVSSGIYVEFGGKGFLRVFMKLMMKMTSNGNGMKVVKRINGLRGRGNFRWSGEMRRDWKEHQRQCVEIGKNTNGESTLLGRH